MKNSYCTCCGVKLPEGHLLCHACERENARWHITDEVMRDIFLPERRHRVKVRAGKGKKAVKTT